MRRAVAVLLLLGALAATALALVAPWWIAAALLAAGVAAMRGRRAFLLFLAAALAINALLLALVSPGEPALLIGPIVLGADGALRGVEGGIRLGAALASNLALFTRVGAVRIVDALRLPARATALLAAVLLAAQDVGRDWERLKTARRLEGAWPARRLARARAAAALLPALALAAHERARIREEALRLAGQPVARWFVPVVAVAALAAAGRLALLAFPNVALTYVVAFLAGIVYGPLLGAAGALFGMALTDLMLTGLYPLGFVNAPAMALLALLGGALRRYPFDGATRAERGAGAAMAACAGILGTLVFSVASDSLTWLLVFHAEPAAWRALVLAGLAFNAIPALVNGALFAASVGPTVRAFRAAGAGRLPRARAAPTPEQASPEAPLPAAR